MESEYLFKLILAFISIIYSILLFKYNLEYEKNTPKNELFLLQKFENIVLWFIIILGIGLGKEFLEMNIHITFLLALLSSYILRIIDPIVLYIIVFHLPQSRLQFFVILIYIICPFVRMIIYYVKLDRLQNNTKKIENSNII